MILLTSPSSNRLSISYTISSVTSIPGLVIAFLVLYASRSFPTLEVSNSTAKMPMLPRNTFRSTSGQSTLAARYRRNLPKHPFLLFGLPFLVVIVGSSFLLTPATAVRYERHDRKQRILSKDEELGLGADRRKVDIRDEYYRLAAKDLENWENRRVPRLKGENDGILE